MSQQAGQGQVVIRYSLMGAPDFISVPSGSLPDDSAPLFYSPATVPGSTGHHDHWLSDADRQRAQRLKNVDQRRLWTETHAALHLQVALLTGSFPHHQPLTIRAGGKPVVCPPTSVHFNLADTDGCSVLAFHRAPVGVDVERISRSFDFHPIVKRYFSAADMRWLKPRQPGDFFLLWTRKEAVLKLTGAGLTDRLSDFDVAADEWTGNGSVMFPDDESLHDIWVYSFFKEDLVFSVALYHPVKKWEAKRLHNV